MVLWFQEVTESKDDFVASDCNSVGMKATRKELDSISIGYQHGWQLNEAEEAW